MITEVHLRALAGGILIGLACAIVLIANGRIAGISGTLGRAFDLEGRSFRLPFLIALIATGIVAFQLFPSAFGPNIDSTAVLVVAGLLVGVGTTVGNGCTSGHGVCGISRGSKRSFVAVGLFMGVAMLTVAIRGAL